METYEAEAHRHFSAVCFNGTWGLLDKPERTPAEDELMLQMAHASFYHWLRRTDCTPINRSVGYWQLSRVYAVLGQGDNALRYAESCVALNATGEMPPFYVGYAWEATARAQLGLGDHAAVAAAMAHAREALAQVTDEGERTALANDLATLS